MFSLHLWSSQKWDLLVQFWREIGKRPVKVRGLRSRASTAGGFVAVEETFLAPLGIAGYNVVCLVDIVSAPTVPFLISYPMLDELGATLSTPRRVMEWEAFPEKTSRLYDVGDMTRCGFMIFEYPPTWVDPYPVTCHRGASGYVLNNIVLEACHMYTRQFFDFG